MTAAIALHPEATDDPQTLRWVAPCSSIPFAGEVVSFPGADEVQGVLSRVVAAPGALFVTLSTGYSWRDEGPRIRRTLIAALSRPDRWVGASDAVELDADGLLHAVAEELIDGPIAEIARVHGGSIELVSAKDGIVSVRMHGACHGCAAASITLHQRLERELRRRVPHFIHVTELP